MRDRKVRVVYGEHFSLPAPDNKEYEPWPTADARVEVEVTLENGEKMEDITDELYGFARALVKTDAAFQRTGIIDDPPVEYTPEQRALIKERGTGGVAVFSTPHHEDDIFPPQDPPDAKVWFNWGKPVSIKDKRVSELSMDELGNLKKSKFYGKGDPGDPTYDKEDTSCRALFEAVNYWLPRKAEQAKK